MKPAFLRFKTQGESKFRSKKVEVDGIMFDSKKEANVYSELKLLQAQGEIASFERQVTYELVPAQYEEVRYLDKKGREKTKQSIVERPVKYIADFKVTFPDGEVSVIDVKGMRLADYKIKRKLMLHIHGIRIKEM